jgi:hypothetical protein
MTYELKVEDRVVAVLDSVEADSAAGREVTEVIEVQASWLTPGDDDDFDLQPVTATIQPTG